MKNEKNKETNIKSTKSRMALGIICAVIGGTCWGVSACFGEYVFSVAPITTNWLISIRLLVAGMLFILIGMAKIGKRTFAIFKNRRDFVSLVIFGLLGMFMSQYTFYTTIKYANAGTATVMQSLATLIILIYTSILTRKMPRPTQLLAILIALAGIFLLSTGGNVSSMQISQIALIAGLLSALGAVFYSTLSGRLIRKYGVYSVAGIGMFISGMIFLPFARPWELAIAITPQLLFGMFGVIIIGTAFAFGFFLKGVSIVGPLLGSIIGTLEPVSAVILSAIFLKTSFSTTDFISFFMIITAVLYLTIAERKKANHQR